MIGTFYRIPAAGDLHHRQLVRDQLVGPIAVAFGDRELMAEL